MKLFKVPITVKEVSFRLTIEVENLLKIHQKISNPDFEAELIKTTGIGWKQVKNYKNHPKQFQIVSDNAKIIEFVENARAKDKLFKIKVLSIYSAILILFGSLFFVTYKFIHTNNPVTYIVVTNKLPSKIINIQKNGFTPTIFQIPDTNEKIRLGPLKDSSINLNEYNCNQLESFNSHNCQKNFSNGARISVITSQEVIYRFNYLMTSTGKLPEELLNLYSKIKSDYKKTNEIKDPISKEKFENQDESIEIITSKLPDGRLFFINFFFELKRN